ncbi:hypothetical protein ACFPU1_16715 [Thalassorhabdus alkalitolerans]|uniref:Type VII secretion protein EssB n=1 Tax=Thalassorhabdus alkalitolerans TaxID=2282697 RepID=A0ABW0YPH3_9BACI
MKVRSFEHGSIQVRANEAIIQLADKHSNLAPFQIENIKETYENTSYCLPVTEVSKEQDRIHIKQAIPNGYLSMNDIHKESLPIRLAVLTNVLEVDPLQTSSSVSIHPATLFFRPMSHVLFSYMATMDMPQENRYTILQQYKALALHLITKQPYETFLVHGEKGFKGRKHILAKREEPDVLKLVQIIREATTAQELREDMHESLEYAQFQYFNEINHTEKRASKKLFTLGAASFITLIVAIGVVQSIHSNQQAVIAEHYEQELLQKETEVEILNDVHHGDYETAVERMEEQHVEENDIVKWLIQEREYQLALDRSPTDGTVTAIVDRLYEQEDEEALLDLEGDNQLLQDEQNILDYNHQAISNRATLVENEETAMRMAQAFIKNNHLNDARIIADRFDSESVAQAIEEQQQRQEVHRIEQEIDLLEAELEDLESDDEGEEVEEIEDQMNQLQEELEEVES